MLYAEGVKGTYTSLLTVLAVSPRASCPPDQTQETEPFKSPLLKTSERTREGGEGP